MTIARCNKKLQNAYCYHVDQCYSPKSYQMYSNTIDNHIKQKKRAQGLNVQPQTKALIILNRSRSITQTSY